MSTIKFITGADPRGLTLLNHLITHLNSLNIPVHDIGVGDYYDIGAKVGKLVSTSPPSSTFGLVACGTGAGVQVFANKFPSVYAVTCRSPDDAINARSINNANVLAVGGGCTDVATGVEILNAFLNTKFKDKCPANGNNEWESEVVEFLDRSVSKMAVIGLPDQPQENGETEVECAICCLAKNREFVPVDIMPGGMMKIVRESPTSAIIRFKAGSVEPAHHHTFGHDLMVLSGKKKVWNLTKKDKFDLVGGDYLFTPAGDVHRVKYHEDTEFFLKWDGPWDIFLDEDLETAKAAIEKEGC